MAYRNVLENVHHGIIFLIILCMNMTTVYSLRIINSHVNSVLCTADQFPCNNGECIRRLWFCDGADDCEDNSDEEWCNIDIDDSHRCPSGFMACADSERCYPRKWNCDGIQDCLDGSDERFCKRTANWTSNVKKDGVLTSPNFPSNYPNNYEGIWKFEVPPGHRLELVFNYFDIEQEDNCAFDYVAVYDGPLESHPLLKKFCGTGRISPIIKTTPGEMIMIFRTDNNNVGKGFKVTHTTKFDLNSVVSSETKRSLIQYFLNKRQQTHGISKWGTDIARTAVALFFADERYFAVGNDTGKEIAYELTLQLMSRLVMKKRISTEDLALYVNALTVACINPKQFFGLNIVAGLRKRIDNSNHTNPFFLLALCIGGGNVSMEDVHELQQFFDAHLQSSWTGTQAMIVMALKCISQKSQINLDATFENMVSKLKERQQSNGTVENLKTTALVIQALMATESYRINFNLSMAINSMIEDMKNTRLSTEKMYYILPIVMWKTFLNIRSNHCENVIKTDLKEMNPGESRNPDEQIHAQVSIIIGDEMDFSRTWRIHVPTNDTLYQVMENIHFSDPDYKVQYTVSGGKPYIVGLGNYENSIESGLRWFIYTKQLSSSGDLILVEKSPADIQVNESHELILWYRSGPWSRTQYISSYALSTDSTDVSTGATDVSSTGVSTGATAVPSTDTASTPLNINDYFSVPYDYIFH